MEVNIEYLNIFFLFVESIFSPENMNPTNGNIDTNKVADGDIRASINEKNNTKANNSIVSRLKRPKEINRSLAIKYGKKGIDR